MSDTTVQCWKVRQILVFVFENCQTNHKPYQPGQPRVAIGSWSKLQFERHICLCKNIFWENENLFPFSVSFQYWDCTVIADEIPISYCDSRRDPNKLLSIFPEAPIKVNVALVNVQGNLTDMYPMKSRSTDIKFGLFWFYAFDEIIYLL